MSKAVANCTCKVCGEKFTRTATKYNRTLADEWEKWAEDSFDLCPSCWGRQQREREIARGLCADIVLGNPYGSDRENLYIIFSGDTMPYKDTLKSIGCHWTCEYPSEEDGIDGGLLFGLGVDQTPYRWVALASICQADSLPKFLQRVEDAGLKLAECKIPSDSQIKMHSAIVSKCLADAEKEKLKREAEMANKKAIIDAKLLSLGKIPPWDEDINSMWPKGGTWNGKFYGKPGQWVIYIQNQKISLKDDQKARMEKRTSSASSGVKQRKK